MNYLFKCTNPACSWIGIRYANLRRCPACRANAVRVLPPNPYVEAVNTIAELKEIIKARDEVIIYLQKEIAGLKENLELDELKE